MRQAVVRRPPAGPAPISAAAAAPASREGAWVSTDGILSQPGAGPPDEPAAPDPAFAAPEAEIGSPAVVRAVTAPVRAGDGPRPAPNRGVGTDKSRRQRTGGTAPPADGAAAATSGGALAAVLAAGPTDADGELPARDTGGAAAARADAPAVALAADAAGAGVASALARPDATAGGPLVTPEVGALVTPDVGRGAATAARADAPAVAHAAGAAPRADDA